MFEVLLYAIRTIISRIGPFNVNEVDVLPFQDFCDLRQLMSKKNTFLPHQIGIS